MTTVSMETLPEKMKRLPTDPSRGGIPVPWFVDWVDGKPEFRAADPRKWRQAVAQRLCWVCGQTLATTKCFVAGPMCAVSRTTAEPPGHPECSRWSAINCPFLSNPHQVRREDALINNQRIRDTSPGLAITRNPGVAMLWFTRSYELFPDQNNRALITMGNPIAVEWWCRGREATRAEVQESIDSGKPALVAMAQQDEGGMKHLEFCIERLQPWLPQL